MRLLTHNTMKCPAKDVQEGYPLGLEIEEMEVEESECNVDFLRSLLPTLNWEAIKVAGKACGLGDIPSNFNNELLDDFDFIKAMHNLLFDVHVVKGCLICPESGRRFEIKNRVPDMT